MKALFICRASTKDGFGHLFRCRALLAEKPPGIDCSLVIIGQGTEALSKSGQGVHERVIDNDESITAIFEEVRPDIVVFDLNQLDHRVFEQIRQACFTVCLSPLFEHISKVDQVFNRTIYFEKDIHGPEVYASLDYSIISDQCVAIPEQVYKEHLHDQKLAIAISMGGGDAPNKTLEVVRALGEFPGEAIFWIMVGEGYPHSYDALIKKADLSPRHEVILARTNQSMWRILRNCHLAVLCGGVTSHEAVYAGLPAVNLVEFVDRFYLVKELVEQDACFYIGGLSKRTLEKLTSLLVQLNQNRDLLWDMHVSASGLIDGKGAERTWQRVLEGAQKRFSLVGT